MNNNFKINSLFNFGFIEDIIPKDLYESLLKECLTAEKKNKKFISGLTGAGVAEHFFVEKNKKKLLDFIKIFKQKYESVFPGTANVKILTKNVNFNFGDPWINFQKKNQFVPNHTHDGILSYTIWIKIPYNSADEFKYTGGFHAGSFEFTYNSIIGNIQCKTINLNKNDSGKIIMFPAKLLHCVYPFFSTDKTRISISGNILLEPN
jgi:hypothetical protein